MSCQTALPIASLITLVMLFLVMAMSMLVRRSHRTVRRGFTSQDEYKAALDRRSEALDRLDTALDERRAGLANLAGALDERQAVLDRWEDTLRAASSGIGGVTVAAKTSDETQPKGGA
jgi:hypothetical protein